MDNGKGVPASPSCATAQIQSQKAGVYPMSWALGSRDYGTFLGLASTRKSSLLSCRCAVGLLRGTSWPQGERLLPMECPDPIEMGLFFMLIACFYVSKIIHAHCTVAHF